MATYKLSAYAAMVIQLADDGQEWSFAYDPNLPDSALNQISQQYRVWLADGNEPASADTLPEPVPDPDDETRSAYLQMAEEEGPDSAVQILIELYRFDRGLS